jgi:hypothetical protein
MIKSRLNVIGTFVEGPDGFELEVRCPNCLAEYVDLCVKGSGETRGGIKVYTWCECCETETTIFDSN